MADDDGVRPLGSSPLALDGADGAFLVEKGSVDVFAVPSSDGRRGPRRHLFSAEAGDLLPAAPRPKGASFGLIAVGLGETLLRAVPTTALDREDLVPAVERLVAQLAPRLPKESSALLHELLSAGGETLLPRGRRAAVREHVLWVRHLEGTTRIGARPELTLGPAEGWVPLCGLWLEAADGDARLLSQDTKGVLAEGGGFSGLRVLLGLVQSSLALEAAAEEARTASRLREEAASSRRHFEAGLSELASLVRSETSAAERESTVAREPLQAACRAIGAAAGIAFRDPPAWEVADGRDLLPAICRASRVRSRRVALRGAWWRSASGPLLGYRDEGEAPVALLPAGPGRYEILDPRDGVRRPLTPAAAAGLRPFGVTFYRPLPDGARRVRDLLSFALPLVRADVASIGGVAFLGSLLSLTLPVATAHVFNRVIPNARSGDLVVVLVALTAAAIGGAFLDLARALALTRTEARLGAATQAALVDRLLALPVAFFRRYTVGDLAQRASTIPSLQEQVGSSTVAVLIVSVFSLANLIVLFSYDLRLALLAVALLLVVGTVDALVVRQLIRLERLEAGAQARVAGLVFQVLSGIAKLRVSGSESRAFAVFCRAFARQRALADRAGRWRAALSVLNEVVPLIATALLFTGGGWLLFQKGEALPTGDFVAFSAAFGALVAAAVAFASTSVSLASAAAALERVAPILQASPEVTEAKDDPGTLAGLVEGVHLTFRYHPDGPLVLDDVSFRAEPGQFVAFVGPSGSGKSTTLRLLLGFETPATGAIYYDGQDLASLDVSAIRNQQLGVVLQNGRLLSGDVFTNIVGASSRLTLEDAWEAAEAVGLAGDIRDMPMGMHTVISEGGSTLSGGQRQRLLIARALVRRPRIILFDEATSALDNRTQETVTRTLELASATRIVIAHRLSTIRKADRIYVLDRGRVVEHGGFDELASGGGLFARLIARQHASGPVRHSGDPSARG